MPNKSGMAAKKIIVVPCIVKSWLNVPGPIASARAVLNCQRISRASTPPIPEHQAQRYRGCQSACGHRGHPSERHPIMSRRGGVE
jgi:hypothetical protein